MGTSYRATLTLILLTGLLTTASSQCPLVSSLRGKIEVSHFCPFIVVVSSSYYYQPGSILNMTLVSETSLQSFKYYNVHITDAADNSMGEFMEGEHLCNNRRMVTHNPRAPTNTMEREFSWRAPITNVGTLFMRISVGTENTDGTLSKWQPCTRTSGLLEPASNVPADLFESIQLPLLDHQNPPFRRSTEVINIQPPPPMHTGNEELHESPFLPVPPIPAIPPVRGGQKDMEIPAIPIIPEIPLPNSNIGNNNQINFRGGPFNNNNNNINNQPGGMFKTAPNLNDHIWDYPATTMPVPVAGERRPITVPYNTRRPNPAPYTRQPAPLPYTRGPAPPVPAQPVTRPVHYQPQTMRPPQPSIPVARPTQIAPPAVRTYQPSPPIMRPDQPSPHPRPALNRMVTTTHRWTNSKGQPSNNLWPPGGLGNNMPPFPTFAPDFQTDGVSWCKPKGAPQFYIVPGTRCSEYAMWPNSARFSCQPNLMFSVVNCGCAYAKNVNCQV